MAGEGEAAGAAAVTDPLGFERSVDWDEGPLYPRLRGHAISGGESEGFHRGIVGFVAMRLTVIMTPSAQTFAFGRTSPTQGSHVRVRHEQRKKCCAAVKRRCEHN